MHGTVANSLQKYTLERLMLLNLKCQMLKIKFLLNNSLSSKWEAALLSEMNLYDITCLGFPTIKIKYQSINIYKGVQREQKENKKQNEQLIDNNSQNITQKTKISSNNGQSKMDCNHYIKIEQTVSLDVRYVLKNEIKI